MEIICKLFYNKRKIMAEEKIKVKSKNNLILSIIFKSEKYYTMRPGIDFPLTMNYRAVEQ
jgi:hypothetical protein